MNNKHLFTSESVTEGHPDKVCDQISDAILDDIMAKDPTAHVACEVTATTGMVHVMGEISTECYVDIDAIARKVIKEIGYDSPDAGFNGATCAVLTSIDMQSPDIAMGVNESLETKNGAADQDDLIGAGDQGMMFGYACNETREMMPATLILSHVILKELAVIRREGKVLPGNIIKIDGFLNHRVDTKLLGDIADEFAKYFDTSKATVVLTAEASGIALATVCAERYGVPMLFAKKAKSDNIESGLIQSEIFSYTYKKKVTLLVSQEWLSENDRVLIIDDFMANGYAMGGLVDIVRKAGAQLVGIGVAVEKGFQGGGDKFRAMPDIPYKALAVIESADENGIIFREDD